MRKSRKVLAFVPQHTTTKSRVMAVVDKGGGMEIDAIATVDYAHQAVALCNLLNTPSAPRALSGLWLSLDDVIRTSLEHAEKELVDETNDSYLAPLFVQVIEDEDNPSTGLTSKDDIDWASLFSPTECPQDGCDVCSGCAAEGCRPGGSCECLKENLDDCPCAILTVGPRWAAAIYESLSGMTPVLFENAQQSMWGIEEYLPDLPASLISQPPHFFVRLAQTCATLARLLESGLTPVPHTIAELILLEAAAQESIVVRLSGKDHDDLDLEDLEQLPEGHGDLDMDALWMFQFTESDWLEIVNHEAVYEPGSMDRIFDLLPEAAEFPRERGAVELSRPSK